MQLTVVCVVWGIHTRARICQNREVCGVLRLSRHLMGQLEYVFAASHLLHCYRQPNT